MILDKILSFLFGIKKSKFEITERELEKITDDVDENQENDKHEKEIIDVITTPLFKYSFEELSKTIFEEAKHKFKINRYNYWAPKFTSLDSYIFLSEQQISFKRDFAYWITKEIIWFETTPNIAKPPLKTQYLQEILQLLLRSNLHFKENDFEYFMNLWVQYPTYVSIASLTSRLRKKTKNDTVSKEFYQYLQKFLKTPRFHNEWYNYYKTPRNTIQRILHLYAKDNDENQPSFLLASDPFADYINKFIRNCDQKEQDAYCHIFKTFEENKQFYNPFKLIVLIQEELNTIGRNAYKIQMLHFIKKASLFKPKMSNLRVEKVTYNTGKEVRYNCQYIKKENIAILKSIIISLADFKHKKSAIPYLLRITERSFSNANAVRLGQTSQSLGKLCIYTLANHYEETGIQKIKNLYQETTYKQIKQTIEKESKILKEQMGISLI
ncbi:hypothetical protein GCM10009430_42470 [Aquimarina litoralis]|uniref:Uncharacterized protein n=1 Tax=Aquimarina litoralis TaxID=584605 RepID=A0ABP3UEW2_9FLAO